jgi:hypothetical protein
MFTIANTTVCNIKHHASARIGVRMVDHVPSMHLKTNGADVNLGNGATVAA